MTQKLLESQVVDSTIWQNCWQLQIKKLTHLSSLKNQAIGVKGQHLTAGNTKLTQKTL